LCVVSVVSSGVLVCSVVVSESEQGADKEAGGCNLENNIRLVERDFQIIQELDRWRVCLGRHIKELADFSGQRACDRRLSKLISAGYIERKKILYGVPSIYCNTRKAKLVAHITGADNKIRVEQIKHDIAVLDIAVFIHKNFGIPFSDMTTEKQLHSQDGFGVRKHKPDFVYQKNNKFFCVEFESSLKSKSRFEENMKQNFLDYEKQIWVVPDEEYKILHILEDNKKRYTNIRIVKFSEVREHE